MTTLLFNFFRIVKEPGRLQNTPECKEKSAEPTKAAIWLLLQPVFFPFLLHQAQQDAVTFSFCFLKTRYPEAPGQLSVPTVLKSRLVGLRCLSTTTPLSLKTNTVHRIEKGGRGE